MSIGLEAVFRISIGFFGGVASLVGQQAYQNFIGKRHLLRLCGSYKVYANPDNPHEYIENEDVNISITKGNLLLMKSIGGEDGPWVSEITLDSDLPTMGRGVYHHKSNRGGSGTHQILFNDTDSSIIVSVQNISNPQEFQGPTSYILRPKSKTSESSSK